MRTGWRRMRRRPLQYVLFVLGVALGVAMMVSIDLANGSARRAFQLSTDAIAGKTTHRIFAGPTGVPDSLYVSLRRDLGQGLAAPVVEGYVMAPVLGDAPVRLIGVDPFAEPPFRTYLVGASPGEAEDLALTAFLTQPNTVLISSALAARHDLRVGDDLSLEVAGQPQTARISGLIEPSDDVTRRGLDNVLFTDISNAQQIFDRPNSLSHVDLILPDAAAVDRIEAFLPTGTRLETAAARGNAVAQMASAFELNLTAMSLLALVVGMFLIYNTVTFSVVQRRQLFGILRALGVTGRQLAVLILGEAALLGAIGAGLGLAIGVLLGQGMVRLVTQTINDFYFVVSVTDVSVPAGTLIRGLLIGVAAAVAASVPPALEAARTTPSSGLRRSTLESRARRLMPWLFAAWAALSGVGALLLWLQGVSLLITFTGLFAVLIGFALLTPPLTLWLMERLPPISGRLFGPLGRMAPRDIARSLSRTSVAIAALMTAVSVIIGVSIMIGSFRGTVETWLNATLRADIYVSPPTLAANRVEGSVRPDIVAEIAAWPGVTRAVTARSVDVLAPDFDRQIELLAVSGDIAGESRPYVWLADEQEVVWSRLLAGEGVVISEPLFNREGLSLPPAPITLLTPEGERTFPVLGVFYDYASDRGTVWMGSNPYQRLWGDAAVSSVAAFVAPEVDVDRVVEEMETTFGERQALTISSNRGLRNASLDIFDRTFAVTAALQLLATLVAFIGVLSALLSLQLERQRELGVLRANGMTLGQLWRLTFLETGLMGALAGVLAIPTGFVLAWILIYVINVRSFGWTLQMQATPAQFLQALAVAIVAALLAGIYPSLRLGRTVIATAIRQE
jgi:putative ABC transport system permease protein